MAWRCASCGETVEDDAFQVCWKCGSPRAVDPVSDTHPATPAPLPPPLPEPDPRGTRRCPSCHTDLTLKGTVPVRLAPPDEDWDPLPTGWERDRKLWGLEAWICPACRRVLLYEVRR